ncbi:MAG: Rrf2 family transcriptional regulator [Candidatus Omnitrophica bacterium]|nr:Rrf2 family transcriptional regulator [Candidatus Omnitrophota bacterium]
MGISTKSTYGIRAMFELALHYGNSPISVTYISKRENISISYLEQLLSRLRRKALVKSVRGPAGGYILAKDPKDITVGDIVMALDGEITPSHCVGGKVGNKNCKMIDKCVTRAVWQKLKGAIDGVLGGVTLRDLCNNAKKLGIDKVVEHKYMFNI